MTSRSDALDRACEKIWTEISVLLDRRRILRTVEPTPNVESEILDLERRLEELRDYSRYFRDLMRRETIGGV